MRACNKEGWTTRDPARPGLAPPPARKITMWLRRVSETNNRRAPATPDVSTATPSTVLTHLSPTPMNGLTKPFRINLGRLSDVSFAPSVAQIGPMDALQMIPEALSDRLAKPGGKQVTG